MYQCIRDHYIIMIIIPTLHILIMENQLDWSLTWRWMVFYEGSLYEAHWFMIQSSLFYCQLVYDEYFKPLLLDHIDISILTWWYGNISLWWLLGWWSVRWAMSCLRCWQYFMFYWAAQLVSQCKLIFQSIIRLKVKPNDPSRETSPDQCKHWQM